MLKLLIVDDEPLIRAGIRADVEGLESVQVAGECGSVAEAVSALRSGRFDLVLLDVQMPDGTGFDVIRQVGPQQMPAVVFVTAYDKYAIQAFEVNAVDYLLKPFDDIRLKESIARAQERLAGPSELMRRLESLLEAQQQRWPQKLVIRSGDRYDFVPVDSIDWIEAANNYVILHCRTKNYLYGQTLTALEQVLDPARFVRVHRSRMVNLARVVGVNAIAGAVYELELEGGTRLSTGRQYSDRVRKLLKAPGWESPRATPAAGTVSRRREEDSR
ncbi:MAG TPA: LytTR family DNA-binding domain-containing protein [Bryobacteraceae bacterium]|nr:LytTR family DNA-binding domain-containing protein [Bryobacteraceae bacterium]